MAVRTEQSEVGTATTEGQYSPVQPEQARLVSGLLYGTVSDSKMQWHSVSDSKMQLQKRFVTESDNLKQLLILKLKKGFLVDQTIFSWLQNIDQVSVK